MKIYNKAILISGLLLALMGTSCKGEGTTDKNADTEATETGQNIGSSTDSTSVDADHPNPSNN